jgi:hypothetical protein
MGLLARVAASLSRRTALCLVGTALLLGLIAPASPLSAQNTPSYQLSLSVTLKDGAGGSVTDNSGNLNCVSCSTDPWGYKSGTTVTLTASPVSGTTFQGWGGACSGTSPTCTVTINADTSVSATFEGSQAQPYLLQVNVTNSNQGSGTVTSSPAGLNCGNGCTSAVKGFNSGTVVTLTETPSNGSTFQGWGGACTGTGTCNVTMSSSQTVTAAFASGSGSSGNSNNSNSSFPNVIAPVFNSNGNSSFIRLGNAGSTTTTFTVAVFGSPSGVVYGTTQYQVPANASPQYALSSVLTAAGAGALAYGDTSYRLTIQDQAPSLSYQHVIYNGSNGFFENVSACHFDATGDYSGLDSILFNVHTTLLANYPAQIYVDNYAASAATYNVSIYDNNTGALIGAVPITIPGKSTYTQPFSWFEQQLNWTPSSSQAHANLVFSPVSPATFQIEVSDYIFNQQLSAYVNMTQRCGVSH